MRFEDFKSVDVGRISSSTTSQLSFASQRQGFFAGARLGDDLDVVGGGELLPVSSTSDVRSDPLVPSIVHPYRRSSSDRIFVVDRIDQFAISLDGPSSSPIRRAIMTGDISIRTAVVHSISTAGSGQILFHPSSIMTWPSGQTLPG